MPDDRFSFFLRSLALFFGLKLKLCIFGVIYHWSYERKMVILGLSCSVYNLIKNDYMIPAQVVVVDKKAGYKEIKMAIDEGVVMNVP